MPRVTQPVNGRPWDPPPTALPPGMIQVQARQVAARVWPGWGYLLIHFLRFQGLFWNDRKALESPSLWADEF